MTVGGLAVIEVHMSGEVGGWDAGEAVRFEAERVREHRRIGECMDAVVAISVSIAFSYSI